MIPVVIGALGTIPKRLVKGLEDLGVRGQVETKGFLRSARILRIVLETRGDLLLLKLSLKHPVEDYRLMLV